MTVLRREPARLSWVIGAERLPFRVRTSGRLYLGINDDTLDDDTGAFQVAVTR